MFDRPWTSAFGVLMTAAFVFQLATSTRPESIDPDFVQLTGDFESGARVENAQPEKSPGKVDPGESVTPKPQGKTSEPEDSRILLDEGFDGSTLDPQVWNTCHWWNDNGCTISSNNELEWYVPDQVRVRDGKLNLTADRRTLTGSDGRRYDIASGMVTTGPPTSRTPAKLAFTYGKVEARVLLPEGPGLWPAIWLLPASTESRPEIDILEVLGREPGKLRMRMHPKDRSTESFGEHYTIPGGYSLLGGWHTVGLDWTPGKLVYLLDGKKVWQLVDDQVPDEPMYLVMNLAVGGDYAGLPDESTGFPATMSIDHVRIRKHG